jgi:hypothetical protein
MNHLRFILVLSGILTAGGLFAQELSLAVQSKIDDQLRLLQSWASNAVVLKAVREHNANLPTDQAAMTQEKWDALTLLDPWVRAFSKNDLGVFLKTKKTDVVGEIFVSGADGLKVAFTSKTSNWSHKGKPKHDIPMSGKTWQGKSELDASTGLQTVQISVPVMDEGKPIGSIVVGLVVSKLGD